VVPFEEEEEGTGIGSDVHGAESSHPRSFDVRNDTGTAISPILGQTRQSNTHKSFKSSARTNVQKSLILVIRSIPSKTPYNTFEQPKTLCNTLQHPVTPYITL